MKPLLNPNPKKLFSCRSLAVSALTALTVFIAVPHPATAQTVVTQPGTAPHRLSAESLRQIGALEAEADARTPAQMKINSQLLFTLKTARGQVIAPGVPRQRTSVVVDGTGMTLVDIDGTISPALLAAIRHAGGTVVGSSVQFGQMRALVPLSSVETLAALPDVRLIKPAVKSQLQNPAPVHSGTGLMQRKSEVLTHLPSLLSQVDVNVRASRLLGINFADSASASGVGSFTDEGDSTHQANTARSAYGINGSGIKVGVLSDSLDNGNGIYNDALNSGDVSPVTVISGQSGGAGTGEGLAMLEVVHHLAPGAQLYFATGAAGEGQFGDNIIALQQAGCKVIIDDEGYFDESPFQDDVISQAINTVTANGAMYFSSAANNGNLVNQTSSVWENDYVDSGDYILPNGSSDGEIHLFDTNTGDEEDYINASGSSDRSQTKVGQTHVSLFWTDPLGSPATTTTCSFWTVAATSFPPRLTARPAHRTPTSRQWLRTVIMRSLFCTPAPHAICISILMISTVPWAFKRLTALGATMPPLMPSASRQLPPQQGKTVIRQVPIQMPSTVRMSWRRSAMTVRVKCTSARMAHLSRAA